MDIAIEGAKTETYLVAIDLRRRYVHVSATDISGKILFS